MFRHQMVFAAVLLLHVFDLGLAISCFDENNNAVDWLIAYKLPKLKDNANKLIKSGGAYAYISSADSSTWKLSSKKVSDLTGTPFANTLAPVYANKTGRMGALFYNDQPPGKKECTTKKGHSKGVVLLDESDSTAVWIVHSVPHFPPSNGTFIYPSTGFLYGQHFLCVSLRGEDAEAIGTQFLYTRPCYYGVNLTDSQRSTYKVLASSAANDAHVTQPPWQRSATLKTRDGVQLVHFAKYTDFEADLYAAFVAPSLGTSLRTETWQNDGAADRLSSNCTGQYHVENILALDTKYQDAEAAYPEQNDHAKWAVAVDWQTSEAAKAAAQRKAEAMHRDTWNVRWTHEDAGQVVRMKMHFEEELAEMEKAKRTTDEKYWVCLGDINRESSQFKRPGGTLCIFNQSVWSNFNTTVAQVEKCS